MPGRARGFFAAWRDLAPSDRTLSRAARRALRGTAERAEDAVLDALTMLAVTNDNRVAYLQAHLTRMPGWAAHVHFQTSGIDVLDYLAMRLTYEAVLLDPQPAAGELPRAEQAAAIPSARHRAAHLAEVLGLIPASEAEITSAARVLTALPVTSREVLWQNAFEAHYRDSLLSELSDRVPLPAAHPHTQVVTCIDTRSEGLRRHLEAPGDYETLGFAGFFAVAIRFTGVLGGRPADLCPVLISPNHDIVERPAPQADKAVARQVSGATGLAGAESAFHSAKEAFAAPFTLAEAAGWVAAPLSAAFAASESPSNTRGKKCSF
jgi:uncharacterized protein YbcC (UPF0753/DUF2309 family)